MTEYCNHRSCKIDALAELVYVTELKNKKPLTSAEFGKMQLTMFASSAQVRCRIVPREPHNGAPQAPFG